MVANRKCPTAILTVLVAATSVVVAEDLVPPPWRGEPGTTFAHWGFGTDQPGGPDVAVDNPFGTPQLVTISVTDGGWLATSDGRGGVWSLASSSGDRLRFTIPMEDPPPPGMHLEVHIQFAFRRIDGATLALGSDFPVSSTQFSPLPGGWTHLATVLENPTCTAQTSVSVAALGAAGRFIEVDDLLIDTRCAADDGPIPTVSQWGLILLGVLLTVAAAVTIRRRVVRFAHQA